MTEDFLGMLGPPPRAKPPLRYARSATSSLPGLEQTAPRVSFSERSQSRTSGHSHTPLSGRSQISIDSLLDKPLPDTPSPSKLHEFLEGDIIDSYKHRTPPYDAKHPNTYKLAPSSSIWSNSSEAFVSPLTQFFGTNSDHDLKPPTYIYEQNPYAASDSRLVKPPSALAPPKSRSNLDRSRFDFHDSSQSSLRSAASPYSFTPSVTPSEAHSVHYRMEPKGASTLSPISSLTPLQTHIPPPASSYSSPYYPVSPRITNVADDNGLVPSPLYSSTSRLSQTSTSKHSQLGTEISTRLSSDFSIAPSEKASIYSAAARDSLERFQGKTFSSPPIQNNPERHRPPHIETVQKTAPELAREYRRASLSSPRTPRTPRSPWRKSGASIQNGITSMYDTLTGLAPSKSKHKTSKSVPFTATIREDVGTPIPLDRRTPAIPKTAYQHLGAKAWELEDKSSGKHKVKDKKGFFDKVVGSGEKKISSKDKESAKKREELKGKIRVIGLANQSPDGQVNSWI